MVFIKGNKIVVRDGSLGILVCIKSVTNVINSQQIPTTFDYLTYRNYQYHGDPKLTIIFSIKYKPQMVPLRIKSANMNFFLLFLYYIAIFLLFAIKRNINLNIPRVRKVPYVITISCPF